MKKIMKVLVVDDNKEGRMLLSKLLTSNNYEVKEVCNGIEALESLKISKPDLIISDILMPGMDGFTLIRELNKDISRGKIPVVFYSAQYLNEKDKELAEKLGASRFIIKPAEPKDILKEIKTVLAEFESAEQKHMKSHISKDEEYLSEYAERVFRKLEDKVKELEQEITERKRAEDALRESEARLQSILDNSSTVVFLKDVEGRYITVNRRYEELFHVTRQTVVGKSDHDIFPRENADRFRQHDLLALEKGGPFEVEEFVPHDDGLHVYISVKFPLFTAEEKPYAVCGIATDITERKRAEAAIREREERLHQAVRVSQIGIFDHDHRTDTIYWSPEQRHIYGLGHEEPVTLSAFLKYVYPEDRERIAKAVRRAHDPAGDGSFDVEHRIVDRNGSIHWLSTRSRTQFEGEGSSCHPVRTIGAVADITERKSAEDKIEASLKEKEILLREIHHRVKNNMQIISSLIGLASGNIKDKKYVDMFRESQNRINSMSLIHEKLYRSRNLAKIELNEYIWDLAKAIFQSRGVKTGTIVLTINIENVQLGIDQSIALGLIINELITNSLKYAFPGDRKGEIKVSLHLNDENTFELIVSDNGNGIPYDLNYRKTESLGLRLVTILVENQLKGKIDLDRSKGTEFNIKFQGR
jgi:PAS domain S-box-containing protein